MVVDFRIDAVLRQNQPSAAPTLTRIGGFGTDRIDWTEELNGVPDLKFTVNADALEPEVRGAMFDLVAQPLEAWLYLDGATAPAFAGPVVGLAPAGGGAVAVTCRGLLHYLNAGGVAADVTYTNADLFTIVKGLVDAYQGRGRNYGLLSTSIGTLGVTGTHTYLATEQHKVLRRVADLAEGQFDYRVNPATRVVELAAAHGADLTAAVGIDSRNVVDPGATVSVDWDDVVAVVYGVGTGPDGAAFTATATNTAVLASFGRVEAFVSWSDIETQAELNARVVAYAAARTSQLFVPSLNLHPVADADVGDFTVGDTVTHRFDYGLGMVEGPRRIATRHVKASRRTGATDISVAFL